MQGLAFPDTARRRFRPRHLALSALVCAFPVLAQDAGGGRPGPELTAFVERGGVKLPLYAVPRLRAGDRVELAAEESIVQSRQWVLVLATVAQKTNQVRTEKVALNEKLAGGGITIQSDDEIPVFVLAPEVRTLFGLTTSSSASADLISGAIVSDPQRFVDLQKVDQINQVVSSITAGISAAISGQKPGDAVDATKAVAAKFGVKTIDPECIKGQVVDARCAAASIVANKDLSVPSMGELGAVAGSLASASLSGEVASNVKLLAAASAFLSRKYRDQYNFAPALGRPTGSDGHVRLYSNARLETGDVKTAYIWVPGWNDGPAPSVALPRGALQCLGTGAIRIKLAGKSPKSEYWNHLTLTLRDGSGDAPRQATVPLEMGRDGEGLSFDFSQLSATIVPRGQTFEAQLSGGFGFDPIKAPGFKVVMPDPDLLAYGVRNADRLVAGDTGSLQVSGHDSAACVKSVTLNADGRPLASSSAEKPGELAFDLSSVKAGDASLQVQQYGIAAAASAVKILKPRARVERVEHFDLDSFLLVRGSLLDRIAGIRVDGVSCVPDSSAAQPDAATAVRFQCGPAALRNASLPARVSIAHVGNEPAAFDMPLLKQQARPHLLLADDPASVLTVLSGKAMQWHFDPSGPDLTDDSELSLILRAAEGYLLDGGAYTLEIRFEDDPRTEASPLSFPLMADRKRGELRTRSPLTFKIAALPSIRNPLLFRVRGSKSGLVGDWAPIKRAVIAVPQLEAASCTLDGDAMRIPGKNLEWIERISGTAGESNGAPPSPGFTIEPCGTARCLRLPGGAGRTHLQVKLLWVDDRTFDVALPASSGCGASTATVP